MENQANTNQIEFIELKISNNDLSQLVENETFHGFKHKLQIDNTDYVKLTIYYSSAKELLVLLKLLNIQQH